MKIFLKINACIILIGLSSLVYSQQHGLLSFDLMSGVVDTLKIPEFDNQIQNEKTNFNMGIFNSDYCSLDSMPPTVNVYPNSNFTKKRQASKDFDINCFPIRTSLKLFIMNNDSLMGLCSGVMISRRHVLTAAHCIANMNENTLKNDSIFICPVFDNGVSNPNFHCSWVKKAYFFKNWNMSQTDIAILELDIPVGDETGWVSIGFDSNDSLLLDGIFYKFLYPNITIPQIDPNNYNGDTLYYIYGIVDLAGTHSLGISNASGIPGESGSSLIKVVNNANYTTYGVLSFSNNLVHTRLTNWKYYSFKSIIINDLELGIPNDFTETEMTVYPNPTTDYLNIISQDNQFIDRIILFDLNGRKLMDKNYSSSPVTLDVSDLPQGMYLLITFSGKNKHVKKIIKNY